MADDIFVTNVTTLVDDRLETDMLSLNRTKAGAIAVAVNDVAARLDRRGVPLTEPERQALVALGERDSEIQLNTDILSSVPEIDRGRLSEMAAILQATYSFVARRLND